MTCDLVAVCIDAQDPQEVGQFWAGLLGWELAEDDGVILLPADDTGFRLRFPLRAEPKVVQNRSHLELTSVSLEQQQETVARALALGGRHTDVGQLPEDEHVVLADPEGNEFCVIEPGNSFLAGCGFLGNVNCDGSQAVGYFWSEALGWPLVWDQDEETAIRSPHGGPKMAWGGPPLMPKTGPERLHLDVAPAGGDTESEVARLLQLGASRLGEDAAAVLLADPDGNEFRVLRR